MPKLSFPGGVLIGCTAGFGRRPRRKGSHNAMSAGSRRVADALAEGRSNDELEPMTTHGRDADVGADLWKVRNAKPLWSRFGTLLGIALGGFDMWCNTLGFSLFGTLRHGKPDRRRAAASEFSPIAYPKPDGKLTFDRLSSVFSPTPITRRTSRRISEGRRPRASEVVRARRLRRAVGALLRRCMNGWRRAIRGL